MTKNKKSDRLENGINGCYFLTFEKRENGKSTVEKQGKILEVSGNFALVAYLPWDGGASFSIEMVNLEKFCDGNARLYLRKEDFLEAADAFFKKA